jgi:hypothetical protein
MALIDHVYLDAGLTDQFDDATDTLGASAINGGSGDGVFWVGIPATDQMLQAASDPGIDQLVVSIVDDDDQTGVDATDIKLALSAAGLDSATAGASLNLGATILGGSANAVPVYYRWANGTGAGVYTDISLSIVERVAVAV